MLKVVSVASNDEAANAERLARNIRATWPDIDAVNDANITIAAGIRLIRECDLLVMFEFDEPRQFSTVQLRDGSPSGKGVVQAGMLLVECKDLDASRLMAVANDLRPIYPNQQSHSTILGQLQAQEIALRSFMERYKIQTPFVYTLAWMLGATEAQLREQTPNLSAAIVGSDVSWFGMLGAAATENSTLLAPKPVSYRKSVRTFAGIFTRERKLSARDQVKLNRFSTEHLIDMVLDDVVSRVGTHQIRLIGRAGTGKSTTLALAAKRIVQRDQVKVLFLTYQRVLRGELDHLVRSLGVATRGVDATIIVNTQHEFLIRAFEDLGGTLPKRDNGEIDYIQLPLAIESFIQQKGVDRLRADAAVLRELDARHFDFAHVFIDEAQDWRPAERDLLRIFFTPEQTVLSDGLDQFAQRQTPCNWLGGVSKAQQYSRELKLSLRMSTNVARYVTEVARAMGINDWEVRAHQSLSGGCVILARTASRPEVFKRVFECSQEAGVSPGDCLIAVPPTLVKKEKRQGEGRDSIITPELRALGYSVWDACDEKRRLIERNPDEIAVVPYDSLRGLEGWATVLLDLDDLYRNKLRHPNLSANEDVDADLVAKRALLMSLTRAAHMLVITVRDEDSPVSKWLREAEDVLSSGGSVEIW